MDKGLIEIEEIEKDYLDNMFFMLSQDIDKMMDGLRSKDKIKNDWIKFFDRVDKIKKIPILQEVPKEFIFGYLISLVNQILHQ